MFRLFEFFSNHAIGKLLPTKIFLKCRYYEVFHKQLDLRNPKTYNEKLQWLKLYDRQSKYIMMTDKYEVKKIVAERIGEDYIIPTLGVWERFDEINFDKLPDQFVLKCTHDSGGIVIVRNKTDFDRIAAKNKLESSLKKNYYWHGREWPYKKIHPKIICEQMINTSDNKPPSDYKIFCFNGEPKFVYIVSDRGENTKFDFFDVNWNRQLLMQHYPTSNYTTKKPENWEEMLNLSRLLSQGIPHVRVDFYIDSDAQIKFGELTFYHFSGFQRFEPEYYDYLLGSWLDIAKLK